MFPCCSPRDQVILEAEYKQNPKPNKAARAEIVEKVSLNEKEVQVRIPFQDAAVLDSDASLKSTWLTRICRYGSKTGGKLIEESHGHFYHTR
jgi:hypothetical protein